MTATACPAGAIGDTTKFATRALPSPSAGEGPGMGGSQLRQGHRPVGIDRANSNAPLLKEPI